MRFVTKSWLLLGALCSFTAVDAARVTPMSAELSQTGRNSSTRIEVTNTEDRELPMEIRMYKGTISEAGELDLQPADEDFLAFPPQVVIKPKAQQVFRVQYLAEKPLDKSQVYYAAISQIPVSLDPTKSVIQVVMRFNVLMNVVPDGTTADPVISWVKPLVRVAPPKQQAAVTPTPAQTGDAPTTSAVAKPDEKTADLPVNEEGVEVRIENRGNRFFAAGRTGWTISGTDTAGQSFSKSFTASEIGSQIGMGVVPPEGARIFFVRTDKVLAEGTAKVTLAK